MTLELPYRNGDQHFYVCSDSDTSNADNVCLQRDLGWRRECTLEEIEKVAIDMLRSRAGKGPLPDLAVEAVLYKAHSAPAPIALHVFYSSVDLHIPASYRRPFG